MNLEDVQKGRIILFIVGIILITILYSAFHLIYNKEQAILTDSILRSTYWSMSKVVFEHYNKKNIILAFGMTVLFAVVMRSIFPVNQIATTALLIFGQLVVNKISKNYILPAILPNVFIITHYISITVLVSLFI